MSNTNSKIFYSILLSALLFTGTACDSNNENKANDQFLNEAELKKIEQMDHAHHLSAKEIEQIQKAKEAYKQATKETKAKANKPNILLNDSINKFNNKVK